MENKNVPMSSQAIVEAMISTLESILNIDKNDNVPNNLSNTFMCIPKRGSEEEERLRGVIDHTLFVLNYVCVQMTFLSERFCEFEMRNFYGYKTEEFFNFMNALCTKKTSKRFKDADFLELGNKIDDRKKAMKNCLLLDRLLVVMIILNSYSFKIQMALLADVVIKQLNTYLYAKV